MSRRTNDAVMAGGVQVTSPRNIGIPRRLREIVAPSINPQVTESEVTDDFLQYHFRQAIAGFPTGAILENRIHFLNIGRMEVFQNNLVIDRTAGDIVLA